jgi:hypothetical protein
MDKAATLSQIPKAKSPNQIAESNRRIKSPNQIAESNPKSECPHESRRQTMP